MVGFGPVTLLFVFFFVPVSYFSPPFLLVCLLVDYLDKFKNSILIYTLIFSCALKCFPKVSLSTVCNIFLTFHSLLIVNISHKMEKICSHKNSYPSIPYALVVAGTTSTYVINHMRQWYCFWFKHSYILQWN